MQPVRAFDPSALRRLRNDAGLTQAKLAEKMGVARTYAWKWEQDGPSAVAPSPANLARLAAILEVQPHRLTAVDEDQALLADLRAWAGLTQAELADKAGMPAPSYAAIEQGIRPLGDAQADALADVLEVAPGRIRAAYQRTRRHRGKAG